MDQQLCFVETVNRTIKDIEKSYSVILKERIEEYGVESLVDEEILSLLTGIEVNTIRKAIEDFGLSELYKYKNSLKITRSQLRKLELLGLFHRRMANAPLKVKPALNSSNKASDFAINLFIGKHYECFYMLCLDAQNRLNHAALIFEGTIDSAPIYPRLIVENALAYRATSVILSHNHPGGSTSPSNADIDATKKISAAFDTINVRVMDHIIVADDKYTSFADKSLI